MLRLLLASLAVLVVLATPADARRGGREDHAQAQAPAPTITSDRAVAIARGQGLTRLHEVKFDDGVWEVEGWTADGRRIELRIHPQTGAILKLEFYTPVPSAG
mgnify:CR=1 FL=1